MRKIEVLVFEGCPNVETTLAQVRAAVALRNEPAEVSVIRVENDEISLAQPWGTTALIDPR